MSNARNKSDLIIETWELLDCESVGAAEIVAIEDAVRARFGEQAVDSPMKIARLLADEGAQLRHSEIMRLYVERNSEPSYDAAFRNVLQFTSLKAALKTIRDLENLRRKFTSDGDKEGLRLLRETALRGKETLRKSAAGKRADPKLRAESAEIAEWLTIWLQSPEVFESWIKLRKRSPGFTEQFGDQDAQ